MINKLRGAKMFIFHLRPSIDFQVLLLIYISQVNFNFNVASCFIFIKFLIL